MMHSVLSHAIQACSGGTATTQAATGGGGGTALGVPGFDVLALFASVALLAVVAAGIALAIVIANRVSVRPVLVAPIPVAARISPDGYYWWDGAAWRPRQ